MAAMGRLVVLWAFSLRPACDPREQEVPISASSSARSLARRLTLWRRRRSGTRVQAGGAREELSTGLSGAERARLASHRETDRTLHGEWPGPPRRGGGARRVRSREGSMRSAGDSCGVWRQRWKGVAGVPFGRRGGAVQARRSLSVRFVCRLTWSWGGPALPDDSGGAGRAPRERGSHLPGGHPSRMREGPHRERVVEAEAAGALADCRGKSARSATGSPGCPVKHAGRSSDGDNRHTRRWTERRTTASGRRSAIGPLFDGDPPGAPVGVRDGNDPGRGGPRTCLSGGRPTVGRLGFRPHRVGPYDVECVRPVLPDQPADSKVSGLARPVPGRAPAAVVANDPSVARRLHGLLDQGAEARP